ncbi:MAG TPA: hypothetical protein VJC09_01325 [Candidatus Saccharimonadales bacterium]|nr:hypothetical protein [Candidatus Saccharimonadales bacterium]
MREKINQEVSVISIFSARQRAAAPYLMSWQNTDYHVGKIGYHHTIKSGDTLHHIYELTDKDSNLCFRLNFNTSNLHWTLETITDGLPS